MLAGLIAAIMSTVDSTLNSASTLILHDFIDVNAKGWDEKRVMNGRESSKLIVSLSNQNICT